MERCTFGLDLSPNQPRDRSEKPDMERKQRHSRWSGHACAKNEVGEMEAGIADNDLELTYYSSPRSVNFQASAVIANYCTRFEPHALVYLRKIARIVDGPATFLMSATKSQLAGSEPHSGRILICVSF